MIAIFKSLSKNFNFLVWMFIALVLLGTTGYGYVMNKKYESVSSSLKEQVEAYRTMARDMEEITKIGRENGELTRRFIDYQHKQYEISLKNDQRISELSERINSQIGTEEDREYSVISPGLLQMSKILDKEIASEKK